MKRQYGYLKKISKKRKLSKKLFKLFSNALINNGIIAREGSIIDASFVDVPRQRNSREDNKTIKDGNIPESFKWCKKIQIVLIKVRR